MAYLNRHLIWAFIFLVLGVMVLRAEKLPDSSSAQSELQFTVFGTRAFTGIAYLSAPEMKSKALKFYSVTLSSVYHYKGDPVLKFYNETGLAAALAAIAAEKKANPSGPEPELKIKPVAMCALPPGMKDAVLLFFPNPSAAVDGLQYNIFPMDMANATVPLGHLVIINAAGRDFIGQINSRIVDIKQGVSIPYGAENGRITVKMARKEPEYQNLICGDRWILEKNQRRLWVLFPMTNSHDLFPDTRCLIEQGPIEEQAARNGVVSVEN